MVIQQSYTGRLWPRCALRAVPPLYYQGDIYPWRMIPRYGTITNSVYGPFLLIFGLRP